MIKFPNQPTHIASGGIRRFVKNRIVEYLLENGPFDLNHLARLDFTNEEEAQFAQLIGYSVSGWEDLSYVSTEKALSVEDDDEDPPMTYEQLSQALLHKGYMLHVSSERNMASHLQHSVREKTGHPVVAICRDGKWAVQYPFGSEGWVTLTKTWQPTEVHALAAVLLELLTSTSES